MRIEPRKNKSGITYSLQYYVKGKRKRIHQDEMESRFGREILSPEDAEECKKMFEQLHEKEILQIQRRLSWENKYYNFTKMIEQFAEWQKERAPNSWENNVFYLKHYVLPFFLTERKLNTAELWTEHFDEFKKWLMTAKKIRGKTDISYSSRNHAIKALNLFLKHLFNKNIIAKLKTCESFPEHLQNYRTIDDIFTEKEIKSIESQLIELGRNEEADFMLLLYYTGLRFNEASGVSLANIFQGEVDNDILAKRLKNNEVDYHGYLVIDSQFQHKMKDGRIQRKPLKGRKKIDEKHARLVPITDKHLWNDILFERVEKQKAILKLKGRDLKDCLLFEIDDATSSVWFRKAQENLKIKYRPWHCLRHTRATLLAGSISDESLIRLWLGHRSTKVFERYNHLFESMIRESKRKTVFNLKKVD